MERKDLDIKGLLIIFLATTLFFFGYQAYLILFAPKETPKQAQQQTQELPKEVPNLLLGSGREAQKPQHIKTYDFEKFKISVSEEGARLVSVYDKKYKRELITEEEKKYGIYPLELFTGDPNIDQLLNFSRYEILQEGSRIRAILKGGKLQVVKTLEYKGDYFKLELRVEGIPKPFVFAGMRVKEDEFYTHAGPVIKIGDKVQRLEVKDLKGKELITGDIKFAGEESRYFFKGFAGSLQAVAIYRVGEGQDSLLAVKGENLLFYAGAKEYARLRNIGLSDVLDYGSLKLLVKPLFIFMHWIYEHLHSWVISIFVLTLLVRLLMFPLTYKSTVAMSKMSELAPKMQELKEKYKDDPVKFQEEMMKLYAEAGFNPMSGCLPILLQIPVFFALYKVLTITADLQLAGFLWVHSLAEKDPYYILPILMGATMIAQQFISPSPEKTQNYIMLITSVVFTFLFANFPAGLVLYWTLNNIFNLGQTYVIKRLTGTGKKPQLQKKKDKKK